MNARTWNICGVVVLFILFLVPFFAHAAGSAFYYTGWLPFWKKESGASDAALHLAALREISPFSYEVNRNGTLRDTFQIGDGIWAQWFSIARSLHTKIIPTVAWFDGSRIHALLSNGSRRRVHEDVIAKMVRTNGFDGVDIDYEAKFAKTSPYFSLFIEGLALRLHPYKKILSCTIESRTPLESLYETIPDTIDRANDYAVLNTYCDEVRVMAYDQGTLDRRLDAAKGNGNFYAPVADPDWVEKVIGETLQGINKKKVLLGIPTYGYEYEVSWDSGATTYRRVKALNYFAALDLAEVVGATPARGNSGELNFTYTTSTFFEVYPILRSYVSSTMSQIFSASTSNSTTTVTRFVSFTDAEAVRQKIELAKKYGLAGVAFFKFDGEADPMIWEEMK